MRNSSLSDDEKMRIVADRLQDIYRAVEELERLFPGRAFTPDGHMVGSIGEAWASWMYGLRLLPSSTETHDAEGPNGTLIQIKATQGDRIALSSEPKHLIVLKIQTNGLASEIYNGPGATAWGAAGRIQKNGQRPISVNRLKILMQTIPDSARLRARPRP